MPRPRKCRTVQHEPMVTYFKPRGIPLKELDEVALPVEGMEALRLADVEGMDHEAASLRMGVSRQTFGRILAAARKAVATAIVEGKGLCIGGGTYKINCRKDTDGRCGCKHKRSREA